MLGLGIGIAFVGYSFAYYGLSQLRKQNFGFLDLVLPQRWAQVQVDPPLNDDGSNPFSAVPFRSGSAPANLPPEIKAKGYGKIGQGILPTPIK
jgi:hypothetical protein